MNPDAVDSVLLEGQLVAAQKQLNGDIILQLEFPDIPAEHFMIASFPQYNVESPVLWIQAKRISVYLSSTLYPESIIKSFTENIKLKCKLRRVMYDKQDMSADYLLVVSDVAGLGYALGFLQYARKLRKPVFYLLDADSPLPVELVPSTFILSSLPSWVTATLPLVEDWGIPARVAAENRPGCYEDGFINMVKEFSQQRKLSCTIFAVGKPGWLERLPLVPDVKMALI